MIGRGAYKLAWISILIKKKIGYIIYGVGQDTRKLIRTPILIKKNQEHTYIHYL